MHEWPVTVAFTDDEADALRRVAEARFDGDQDAAMRWMLSEWLDDRGEGTSPYRR